MDEESDSDGKGENEEQHLRGLLEQEKERSEGYLTRLKYLQADFENYRKRTESQLKDIEDSSLRRLVVTLLSALDELELAVDNAEKAGRKGELSDGLRMVQKNLMASLEAAGLSRIPSVGKPFDPALHEAVERVEGGSEGSDVVKEEVRPGYLFRGKVIRPSMVKVELAAKEPGEQEATASE